MDRVGIQCVPVSYTRTNPESSSLYWSTHEVRATQVVSVHCPTRAERVIHQAVLQPELPDVFTPFRTKDVMPVPTVQTQLLRPKDLDASLLFRSGHKSHTFNHRLYAR